MFSFHAKTQVLTNKMFFYVFRILHEKPCILDIDFHQSLAQKYFDQKRQLNPLHCTLRGGLSCSAYTPRTPFQQRLYPFPSFVRI